MKRILALGGSTSQNSINKQLASFAISRLVGLENIIIDGQPERHNAIRATAFPGMLGKPLSLFRVS